MKDNKALIVGVLIVLVALVAVNLDKTGNVVKDTKISISPTLVESGEYVNIALTPGVRGTDCKISIYSEKGLRKRELTRYCDSTFREYTVIPMKTDANWEGTYYVGVTDRATGEEITTPFEII